MAIAYKEWECVCEALGSGRQVVLLRKGGIHEGRAGFSFKHGRFFLFPSRFHAQAEQVRVPCTSTGGEWEPGDGVPVRFHAEAVWARTLRGWNQVRALVEFHIWEEQLVRSRFAWGEEESIHCALVRVAKLAEPGWFPTREKHGGCRTWIDLPDPPESASAEATPVVDDEAFNSIRAQIEQIVGEREDS